MCIKLFFTFLRCPYTTTTWNSQFFLVDGLKNWNDKAINLFTISLWTRTRPPIFSSNLTHVNVLSIHWATWYDGEKVSLDAKSIFQRRIHWRLCFRIVRSLLGCILIVLCIGSCTLLKHQYFQTMIWDKPPGICRPQNCRLRCLTQSAIKGSSAN